MKLLRFIANVLVCVGLGCLLGYGGLSIAGFLHSVLPGQSALPKYVSPEDNIKYLWLSNEKVMHDAMWEMDMHWAYRLAIAEKLGKAALDGELKGAPRTLGDGLPWPEHFKKRAERTKLELDEKKKALDEFKNYLFTKYKDPNSKNTMITFETDGRMKLEW